MGSQNPSECVELKHCTKPCDVHQGLSRILCLCVCVSLSLYSVTFSVALPSHLPPRHPSKLRPPLVVMDTGSRSVREDVMNACGRGADGCDQYPCRPQGERNPPQQNSTVYKMVNLKWRLGEGSARVKWKPREALGQLAILSPRTTQTKSNKAQKITKEAKIYA